MAEMALGFVLGALLSCAGALLAAAARRAPDHTLPPPAGGVPYRWGELVSGDAAPPAPTGDKAQYHTLEEAAPQE